MATRAEIKETAIQLSNVFISNAADENLTGEEKEAQVCLFLASLTDALPIVKYVPLPLRAKLIDMGVDEVQAYLDEVNIKDFVKKCYLRIKHVLHIQKPFDKNRE